jgi:5'-nucleotidase
MERSIFLWDLDRSLADYDGAMIRDLNRMRSPEEEPFTPANVWTKRATYIHERMEIIKSIPGWWRKLDPLLKGFAVLNLAKTIWMEKVDWCLDKLGENIQVHIVTDEKSGVYGKVLYDDYPPFVSGWLDHRPRGLAIMPITKHTQPHEIHKHPNVILWDGQQPTFNYIERMLKRVLERVPGTPLVLGE